MVPDTVLAVPKSEIAYANYYSTQLHKNCLKNPINGWRTLCLRHILRNYVVYKIKKIGADEEEKAP